MPICHTWTEYIADNDTFVINDSDITALDFGDILPGQSAVKYVGIRYLGNSAETIRFWMDGAYADIYNYDVSLPVLYEQDIAEQGIKIYGKLVLVSDNPTTIVFSDPSDLMPDSSNSLLLENGVVANYKDAGYTEQILAIKIEVPSDDALRGYYYRGLRLLLVYDTV